VNTATIPTSEKGMMHKVGGWPIEYDYLESNDQAKYEKRMYRDASLGFSQATKEMCDTVKKRIDQNNEIDMFEEYFAGEEAENLAENISLKTSMIMKDPNTFKRAATNISWNVETSEVRTGVTYASLRF